MTDVGGQRDTELRLALGMRGGVSLAVWIGGACAELDQLRRCADAPGSFWAQALEASPYDTVVVDVIAGASAGGLNGVLYAASQRYGFPLASVRQLWLRLGDLRGLLRTTAPGTPEAGPTLSLLDGDGGFLVPLQRELRALMGRPAATSQRTTPPSVDLRLAATLVEPVTRRVPSPVDETLLERRFAAGFHFRHLEGHPWLSSDLPAVASPDDPLVAATAWRLALAARASSSYPVAFEAAVVRARRPERYDAPPAGDVDGPLVDVGGRFSDLRESPGGTPPGPQPEPPDFAVMDGGVLDNIPLGRALQAVASLPATRPTRRVLVYVQPGTAGEVDPPGAPEPTLDARRSTVSVVRGAAGALVAGETIAGDVAELEAHNAAIERAATMRLGTLGPLVHAGAATEPDGPLVAAARAAWPTYQPLRADFDARVVRDLLDDPLGVLGSDPFPRTVGGQVIASDRWRSPIADWTTAERERLVSVLAGRFGDRLRVGTSPFDHEAVICAGARPLLRTATLLLEWARHLEGRGVAAASPAKGTLYGAYLFAENLVERPRRLAWVTRAVRRAGDEDLRGWASAAGAAVNGLLKVEPEVAQALTEDLRTGGQAAIEAYARDVRHRLDRLADDPAPEGEDLRTHLFAFMASVAEPLRQAAEATAPLAAEPGDQPSPGALLDAALRAQELTVKALAALEVVCFPEFVAGLPGQRRIEFLRMAAGNRTPLAPCFERLADLAAADPLLQWTPPPGTEGRLSAADGIHVALKLAGNELKNFAAFLKSSWRANDWMWGRLDAVPTLVDLLVTPEGVRRWLRDLDADAAAHAAEELVVGSMDPAWRRWLLTEVWEPRRGAVLAELVALRGDGDATVHALRDALVARRQWEVLAEELAAPTDAEAEPGDEPPAPLPPEPTRALVRDYARGTETITSPKERAHAILAADAARHAAAAIVDNARVLGGDGTEPSLLQSVARRVAAAVRFAGPVAAHALLAPDADQRGLWGLLRRPPRWLAATPTGAAVGLAAFAVVRGPAAAAAALVAAALAPVSWLLWKVRSVAERSRRTAQLAPGRGVAHRSPEDGR